MRVLVSAVSLLATTALLAPVSAYAGGVAPIVTGGFHTEKVYFYSKEKDGGAGALIRDQGQYEQYSATESIGQFGSGLELMLGDRDDFIQGVFRGYWMMDTPQVDPGKVSDLVDADALVASWRTETRHAGVGTVGIQWGVVRAASDRFKLGMSLHVGAGFLTSDHTEFLLAQGGVNVNYQITRTVEFFADVDYGLRVRKTPGHGLYATTGLRFLFD
ncbi:MAG TPA: hypothetical protein PKA64_08995 [Myxococcota bacterium]|nr:hypothetical protein [Myxococcota bacterium]